MTRPPRFTVFTATYQRAALLADVHACLERQTFTDFEWLIVDDGSTDGTADLVQAWQETSVLDVRALRQDHAGKPAAYNRALRASRGELFVNLDSDDVCDPHALATFDALWRSIPERDRSGYLGVCCCCRDERGRRLSGPFPEPVVDATDRQVRYGLRIRTDRWGAVRTDLVRECPYPAVPGEQHLPEGVVQARWPDLPMRCTSEALLVYRRHDPVGRLSREPSVAHPRGHALWHRSVLEHELDWFRADPASFLRTAANYARFSLLDGVGPRTQVSRLTRPLARALWLAGLPAGALAAVRDRARAGRFDASTGGRT